MSKLSDRAVTEIRRLYATGEHTQATLGARFGVSQVQVGNVVRGKSWNKPSKK